MQERRQKENEKKKKIVEIQKKKENILQEKASLVFNMMYSFHCSPSDL